MNTKTRTTTNIVIDPLCCKGCHLCIDQCPQAVLEESPKRNAKGYLMPMAVRIEDCIGCMLCEMICPDLALTVEESTDEK